MQKINLVERKCSILSLLIFHIFCLNNISCFSHLKLLKNDVNFFKFKWLYGLIFPMFTFIKIFITFLDLWALLFPFLASEVFYTHIVFYLVKGGFNFNIFGVLSCINHQVAFPNCIKMHGYVVLMSCVIIINIMILLFDLYRQLWWIL